MTIPVMGWAARVWHAKNARVLLYENGAHRAFIRTPSLLKMGQPTNAEKRALWLAGQHANAEVGAPDIDQEEVDRRMLRVVKRMEGRAQHVEDLEARVAELELELSLADRHTHLALQARCRELEASEHSACERANRLAGECQDLQAKLDAATTIPQDAIQPLWAALVAMVHGIHAPQDLLTQAQMDIAERVAKDLERLLEEQKKEKGT